MANRKKTKEEKTPKSKVKEVASNIEENNGGNSQVEIPSAENLKEQVVNPEHKEEKPKLHVLADDRLNSLINRANELGITDVVQIINSEKYGQFYLVYRE